MQHLQPENSYFESAQAFKYDDVFEPPSAELIDVLLMSQFFLLTFCSTFLIAFVKRIDTSTRSMDHHVFQFATRGQCIKGKQC